MDDNKKKVVNVISGVAIAAGTVGYILTGGGEGDAGTIVTVAVGLVGAITALWNAIKK